MRRYYRHVRDHDLVLTHTLVNPQVNRRLTAAGVPSPDVALHMVERNARGIVVRGARLLATPRTAQRRDRRVPVDHPEERSRVGPVRARLRAPERDPGMRFVCRDSYDEGKSGFDAPLSSRFEEMDAIVLFDDVLVPWERVFLVDDMPACNAVFAATSAVVHLMHQVACKNLAKAEFLVGLLCAMTRASERDELPQVQGMVAEAMWTAETMRALLRTAEAEAAPDRWGTMTPSRTPLDTARNLFPRLYPRLVELVQLLGSSSLMATPCEADFGNALADDVRRYLQLAHADADDRVAPLPPRPRRRGVGLRRPPGALRALLLRSARDARRELLPHVREGPARRARAGHAGARARGVTAPDAFRPVAGPSRDPFRSRRPRRRSSFASPPCALALPANPGSGEPSTARCSRRRATSVLREKASDRDPEGPGGCSPEAAEPGNETAPLVLRRQRRGDRPATLVAEDHEQRSLQVRTRILQRSSDFRREHVARDADDEQLSQAGIENPLGRHARVAATEDRRVGALGLGEIGEGLSSEGGAPSLAPEKPLIPFDQPPQRLIGGEASVFVALLSLSRSTVGCRMAPR